jgi:hypothetical protein
MIKLSDWIAKKTLRELYFFHSIRRCFSNLHLSVPSQYCRGGKLLWLRSHARDKLVILGPAHVQVNSLKLFLRQTRYSGCFECFQNQIIYLKNFKHSSRATSKCLAGCMWPMGLRTLPTPKLVCQNFSVVFCGNKHLIRFKFVYVL